MGMIHWQNEHDEIWGGVVSPRPTPEEGARYAEAWEQRADAIEAGARPRAPRGWYEMERPEQRELVDAWLDAHPSVVR